MVSVSCKSSPVSLKLSAEVGSISQSARFLGKLTLQKGQYLQIPERVREKWKLQAGDSLAIELEGNRIVLRPVAELSPDRSVKNNNIILFPRGEKAVEAQKEVDKVG